MFMGVAQILLDNLDLSHIVIGWYKLFGTSSLVAVPPGGGKPEVAAARQQHDAATAHARQQHDQPCDQPQEADKPKH